jgi:hypothetical protein
MDIIVEWDTPSKKCTGRLISTSQNIDGAWIRIKVGADTFIFYPDLCNFSVYVDKSETTIRALKTYLKHFETMLNDDVCSVILSYLTLDFQKVDIDDLQTIFHQRLID